MRSGVVGALEVRYEMKETDMAVTQRTGVDTMLCPLGD